MNNLYQEMNSLLYEFNNKYQEKQNQCDGYEKFKITQSYIYQNENISKKYDTNINYCKNEYEGKIKKIRENYHNEKAKINEIYEKKINNYKKNCEKEINKIKDNFEKTKIKINNETDDPSKNRIDYQIIFISIILNSNNLKEDSNYYYAKNLFNLLHYFYNNENNDIYLCF